MLPRFKKPKGNGKIEISKAQINEYNRQLKQAEEELKFKMVQQCALLYTAYAMDEEIINRDPEKIVAMYQKLTDWAEHLNDHTISINTVVDIINNATGEEIVHW